MGTSRKLRRRMKREGTHVPSSRQQQRMQERAAKAKFWQQKAAATLDGYTRPRINRISNAFGIVGYSKGKKSEAIARVIGTLDDWDYEGLQRIFSVR